MPSKLAISSAHHVFNSDMNKTLGLGSLMKATINQSDSGDVGATDLYVAVQKLYSYDSIYRS